MNRSRRLLALLLLLLSTAPLLAAPPTFKAGDAVEIREGDLWSPGTVVRNEGRKWLVKYADDHEEWVTADRLRASAAPADAATPVDPAAPTAPVAANANGVTLDGPFTTIKLVPQRGNAPKNVTNPIVVRATTRPAAAFTDLTPASGANLGRVDQLIACADRPGTIVAVGDRRDDETRLLLIDVNNPSASQSRVFVAKDQELVGAADGGRVLLAKSTAWGAKTLHAWAYRVDHYELVANYNFVLGAPEGGKQRGFDKAGDAMKPDWAMLLSPTRMLVRSGFGDTYSIDLAGRRQVGYAEAGEATLHPSGLYLTATSRGQAIILRAADLSIVSQPGKGGGNVTLDPTGNYAALRDGGTVRVIKTSSGEEVAKTTGVSASGRLDLLGPTALLVGGQYYYDAKTGIPVWKYEAPDATSLPLANGQILYVTSQDGATRACMTALPDAAAAAALKAVGPEIFSLSPGAHIAIAGDLGATGNADLARKNLEKAIAGAGHVVDANAKSYVLTVDTKAGPTGKFTASIPRTIPPIAKEYDAPSTITTLTLARDGQTIWSQTMRFQAQVMVPVNGDESVESAIARAGRPDAGRLQYVNLPSHVVRKAPGDDAKVTTLGTSTLTPAGFKPLAS